VGVLNSFFMPLIRAFFSAFSASVQNKSDYHFYFIGTNYATGITHKPVEHMAQEFGMDGLVTEVPERISYFSALATLLHADIIFIPGSTDADYNASKLYNNIFTNKPIFSIFNEKSIVTRAVEETDSGIAVGLHEDDDNEKMTAKIRAAMPGFSRLHKRNNQVASLDEFHAGSMAGKQVDFFNWVLTGHDTASRQSRIHAASIMLLMMQLCHHFTNDIF
jgi:hypothetical protein